MKIYVKYINNNSVNIYILFLNVSYISASLFQNNKISESLLPKKSP